jgi:hypothetical protein
VIGSVAFVLLRRLNDAGQAFRFLLRDNDRPLAHSMPRRQSAAGARSGVAGADRLLMTRAHGFIAKSDLSGEALAAVIA